MFEYELFFSFVGGDFKIQDIIIISTGSSNKWCEERHGLWTVNLIHKVGSLERQGFQDMCLNMFFVGELISRKCFMSVWVSSNNSSLCSVKYVYKSAYSWLISSSLSQLKRWNIWKILFQLICSRLLMKLFCYISHSLLNVKLEGYCTSLKVILTNVQ